MYKIIHLYTRFSSHNSSAFAKCCFLFMCKSIVFFQICDQQNIIYKPNAGLICALNLGVGVGWGYLKEGDRGKRTVYYSCWQLPVYTKLFVEIRNVCFNATFVVLA